MQTQNPVFNTPFRSSYLAVSIQVTTTPQLLSTVIETMLGRPVGTLAKIWREIQWQVDPETSPGLTVRLGNGNLGNTLNGVVQKGISLVGQSDTSRAPMDNVDISLMWVQAVSGTPVMNLQFWS